MPYFTRVLSHQPDPLPIALLEKTLAPFAEAELEIVQGNHARWERVEVYQAGVLLFDLACDAVAPKSLAEAELREFAQQLQHARPAVNVQWLKGFLQAVQVIYAFQIDFDFEDDPHVQLYNAVFEAVLRLSQPALTQADYEGFALPDGSFVVLQFQSQESFEVQVALRAGNQWQRTVLNIQDAEAIARFEAGQTRKR
jgi:hypothetical protein